MAIRGAKYERIFFDAKQKKSLSRQGGLWLHLRFNHSQNVQPDPFQGMPCFFRHRRDGE
jgi:hypothetical protein